MKAVLKSCRPIRVFKIIAHREQSMPRNRRLGGGGGGGFEGFERTPFEDQ